MISLVIISEVVIENVIIGCEAGNTKREGQSPIQGVEVIVFDWLFCIFQQNAHLERSKYQKD